MPLEVRQKSPLIPLFPPLTDKITLQEDPTPLMGLQGEILALPEEDRPHLLRNFADSYAEAGPNFSPGNLPPSLVSDTEMSLLWGSLILRCFYPTPAKDMPILLEWVLALLSMV